MSRIIPKYYSKYDVTINNTTITLIDYFEICCGYTLGNVGKYLVRYKEKNGKEDLEKALTYLDSFNPRYFFTAPFREPRLEQVQGIKLMQTKLNEESNLLFLFHEFLHSLDRLKEDSVLIEAKNNLKLAIEHTIKQEYMDS